MNYYYIGISDAYLTSLIVTNRKDVENAIPENEYNAVLAKVQNKPVDPEGYQYRLRADTQEWELVELPPIEPEPLTDEEALTRYANELTGADDQSLIEATETLIQQRMED